MYSHHFLKKTALLLLLLLGCALGHTQQNCPFMRVSLAADGWVACDNAVCRLRVCNEGNQPAGSARVEVELPAELTYVSASIPATLQGNRVIFNLGTFAPGNCLDFSLTVAVDCALQPGEAVCLTANATPRNCPVTAPGWDGSDLVVRGTCFAPDSLAFRVLNQGAEDMSETTNYVIIEDHLMLDQSTLPLIMNGDSATISVYAPTGKTYTFQTTQTTGHPFPEPISVSVEGCGANPGSTGYLLQYPQHNGDVHSDIFCDTVSAGIGGAGKTGFPLGYGPEHFIDRNTGLGYRLRFQNNGATTVQTVTLVDTLSEWLDLSTFRPGAASHLYTYSIQNRTLTVVFPAAQLPPATVNEPASRGFFSFYIGVSPTAPADALIENTARVQLGNQAPVQTDTTVHRLGTNFITLHVLNAPDANRLSLRVVPNPMHASAQFMFSGADAGLAVSLELFDPAGRLVHAVDARDGRLVLERGTLAPGLYFFRCRDSNGGIAGGKLVIGP